MKWLTNLFKAGKAAHKSPRLSFHDYKREILVKQGREQFKKLVEKGLGVPVALL